MHVDEAAAYAAWIAGEPVPCTCGALLTRTTWVGRREDLDPHDEPEGTWAHQGAHGEILETGHRAVPATWQRPPVEVIDATTDDVRSALRSHLADADVTRAQIDAETAAGRWSANEHRWLAWASHFAGLCGIQGEP